MVGLRNFKVVGWAVPTTWSRWAEPTLLLAPFRFFLRRFGFFDLLGELAEHLGRNQVIIDHSHEQVLNGAAAEAVDDSPHLLGRHVVWLDPRPIDIRPSFDV